MLLFCFLSAMHSGLHRTCKKYLLQCLILHIILCKWQCPHPNPSHCEGFSNVPFLSAMFRILVVELAKAETASTSQTIRTLFLTMFAFVSSSVPFLNAFPRILVVELGLTGLTSTSRDVRGTFHVSSVISVQCFSPERLPSYPKY